MAVHIGIGLFTGQVPPDSGRTFAQEYREVLDLVRLAETLGFDSAWVSEHHGSGDGYLPSLLPMLAAFAAATERMRLGTGVLLTPFHDPLRLAEDCAVIDQLSNGRLILGLGLGWREEEFRMWGQQPSERLRRTVETVEVLRKAWTGKRFSFQGKHYRYDDVLITPPPAREGGVPIWLGGFAEAAVRRAGRIGDGYIRSRGGGIDEMRHSLSVAEEGAAQAGKDPSAMPFAQLQSAFPWEDGDALEVVRVGAGHHLGIYTGWAEGSDTPGKGFWVTPPSDDMLRQTVAMGTPQEVAHRLRPVVDAFGDRGEFHLIVRLHYPGMDYETASRAVELFGEKVIPALKGG
jgi:probable F420-dependent oxidoreductase